MHEFLISHDDHRESALRPAARYLPKVREHIESMPPTSALFEPGEVDGVPEHNGLRQKHLELLGAWPAHYIWDPSNTVRYVNPTYEHADCLSDLVIQCECGTYVTYHRDNEIRTIHDMAGHDDECLPHWRLTCRAKLAEQRYNETIRLTRLGWNDPDLAPRFGLYPGRPSSLARHYNLSMRELYERYQRDAGETYLYLVRKHGVPADLVADIYGHAKSSFSRWAREYDLEIPDPEIDDRERPSGGVPAND